MNPNKEKSNRIIPVLCVLAAAMLAGNTSWSVCVYSPSFVEPAGNQLEGGAPITWVAKIVVTSEDVCYGNAILTRGLPNNPIWVGSAQFSPMGKNETKTFTFTENAPPESGGQTYRFQVQGLPMVATRSVTFLENEVASLSFNPASVKEGGATTGTVTMLFPVRKRVLIELDSASEGIKLPTSASIESGNSSKTFTATAASTPGSVTITAKKQDSAVGKQATVSISLIEVRSIELKQKTAKVGESVNGTITLEERAAAAITVNLASSATLVSLPASVVVPMGQTTGIFSVRAERPGSATITATRSGSTSSGKGEKTIGLEIKE